MKKVYFFLLIFLTPGILLFAQERLITGTVTNSEDGTTIPGATVLVKGTTRGTTTDLDGFYRIEVFPDDSILVFSFIGMTTQEKEIGQQNIIDVVLSPTVVALDEIVVVGYGTESRKLLTGSVSDFKPSTLEEIPVENIDAALQGKVTGVQVTQNSGTPGGGISVRIRGNNSISAGNQPLYVIDGVPMITGDFGQIGFGGQTFNAISDLNPNDIESVTVLKDASATSIYGARASNGVILITTKRGKMQKTQFKFNARVGFQNLAKQLDMLSASQWMEYRNELKINEGAPPVYSPEEIANPPVQTDWIDEITRTGVIQSYELSASSGNEKTTYYLSGGYMSEEGIIKATDYSRLSGRLNLDHNVNNRLKIGTNIYLSNSWNNRVEGDQSLNGVLPNAISLAAVYPIYQEDGTYDESGPYANPVAIANEAINKSQNFRTITSVFANYRILTGLTFETKWSIDYLNVEEHSYDPVTTRQGAKYNGLGYEAGTRASNFNTYNLLRYSTQFNTIHYFEAMAGYSYERFFEKRTFLRGTDFPNEDLQYLISAANITDGSASQVEDRTNSYFGRVKYNFNNKYLFTANLRYDGSSKFGKNNKYGLFPSFSSGWRISEESFFNVAAIDDLKLRVSYGITGNDRIRRYASLSLFDGGGNYYRKAGIYPVQVPNPDLKWETSYQLDVGFDLAMLDSRLRLNLDYYYTKTTDLLLDRPLPASSGFTTVYENIGDLENRGIELALAGDIFSTGNFTWTSTFMLSMNRNKVVKLYKGQPIPDIGRGSNYIMEGEPISIFFGYNSLGVDPSTGDIVFEDVNGDGAITTEDRKRIGSPHPDFYGGFDNIFTYKNLSLKVFIQYSYGNDIYNGTRVYIEALKGDDNQLAAILDRWQKPGDETDIPRATINDPNNNNRASSRFVEDGSYLRIKEMVLSYSVPASLANRLRIENLKLFVSAYNVFTYTNYSGMDPEINYAGDDNLRMGTDFFTYPHSRRIMFGVNIGF